MLRLEIYLGDVLEDVYYLSAATFLRKKINMLVLKTIEDVTSIFLNICSIRVFYQFNGSMTLHTRGDLNPVKSFDINPISISSYTHIVRWLFQLDDFKF